MRNEDLKELLEVHTQAVKAEVRATTDLLGYKIDEVIEHQKVTNGRVTNLEEERLDFREHCNRTDKFFNNWKKNLLVASIFIVAISLASTWLYHNVDIVKTFEKKTGIELLSE